MLVGSGNPALSHPGRLHLPAISAQSSPTWSPDGRDLAVLDGDGILVTDVSTGARRTLPCPGCAEIAWSPDGTRFATVDRAGDGITLVDATTGLMTHSWLRMVTNLHSLTWAPDGRRLAFVGDSRGVRTHTRQAAYVADLRGGGGRVVLSGPMSDGNGRFNPARMLAVSWRPVDDQLAVLVADRGSHGWSSSSLRVVAVNSDGSGMTKLTVDGTCGCGGWTPNLTWSPDGTTLALYAKHRGFRSTLDATGSPVHIRLVRGSGPLAWQPR